MKPNDWNRTYQRLSDVYSILLLLSLGYFIFAKTQDKELALPLGLFCLVLSFCFPLNLFKELKTGYFLIPILLPWPFAKKKQSFPKPSRLLNWMYRHNLETADYSLRPPFNYEIRVISKSGNPLLFTCLIIFEIIAGVVFAAFGLFILNNQALTLAF